MTEQMEKKADGMPDKKTQARPEKKPAAEKPSKKAPVKPERWIPGKMRCWFPNCGATLNVTHTDREMNEKTRVLTVTRSIKCNGPRRHTDKHVEQIKQ